MKSTAQSPTSYPHALAALGTVLMLAATAAAVAQPRPPGPPGGAAEGVAFEVLAIDRESWVVTARDLESGEEFRFRLPPEAFRGQRFRADVSGAGAGQRISVDGEPNARLPQGLVERPLGAAGRSEGTFGAPGAGDGERGADRYAVPAGPGKYAVGSEQRAPSKHTDRPGPLSGRGGGAAGPKGYEVVAVDAGTWTVTARGDDGATVALEVDPQAFVGYRFRASVKDLRAGEGFELTADNESPLANCCTVKDRPGR